MSDRGDRGASKAADAGRAAGSRTERTGRSAPSLDAGKALAGRDVRANPARRSDAPVRGDRRALRRESDAERGARQEILRNTERSVKQRLASTYGRDLTPEARYRLRHTRMRFQDRRTFGDGMKARHPDLPVRPGERVLGVYYGDRGRSYVDYNHPSVHRTIAHEHLHALSDRDARKQLGGRLYEGTTEHLAARLTPKVELKESRRLGLRGTDQSYPKEVLHVEQLSAVVGEPAIRKAYFRGDLGDLREQFDGVLGSGKFREWREAIERGDDAGAQQLISRASRRGLLHGRQV